MFSPSNLYAEKVFSEHPLALWALDDQVDYISLISETQRNLSLWTITNGTAALNSSIINEPFTDSYTSKITATVPSEEFAQTSCVSPNLINFNDLNLSQETFSIGAYVYSSSPYVSGFDIGYEYYDTTTGEKVQNVKNFNTSVYDKWIFISETFQGLKQNTTFKIIININYVSGSSDSEDYVFYVNGVSLGQWSEEFNAISLGVSTSPKPSSIAEYEDMRVIEASTYGLRDNPGYYVVDNLELLAKNSGVPMVYGASNTTILYPGSSGYPSLIIPGEGFLNDEGKYKEYTAEMWLKINSDTKELRRIFGPLHSSDGLFIRGPFITLKIGSNVGSYSVGEWNRPMLVHIRITRDSANLLINGEQVISLNFITDDLSFPEKIIAGSSANTDWLGFWTYEDVSPIEVDCVGIYPYQVPATVAKKRFIYGQGVEFPEGINAAYSGSSVVIDYPFANYSNNYMYPDIGKWDQGFLDNLSVDRDAISLPRYSSPNYIGTVTQEALFVGNSLIQNESDKFISLKPNTSFANSNGYLYLDSLNLLNDNVTAFYGVFKAKELKQGSQTLIRIEDQTAGNYFEIELSGTTVTYKLKYSQEEQDIYKSFGIQIGEKFTVGINIEDFSNYYGKNISSFFGNRSSLKVYIGGNKNQNRTFEGNIYTFGLCNERNFSKISNLFNSFGVPAQYENVFSQYQSAIILDSGESADKVGSYIDKDTRELVSVNNSFWQYILDGGSPSSFTTDFIYDHLASYSLSPIIELGKFTLDVSVSSYWEDNLPLTYFSKYVKDAKGNDVYDLDFLQFNINFPSPSKYLEQESTSSWSYNELLDLYQSPVQKVYNALDNHLYTGYNDYSDLANRSVKRYSFDTSDSILKTYITFQYTKNGANYSLDFFKYTVNPDSNGVVKPGSYVVDINNSENVYDSFLNTKYEVVNNMIIYPPKGIDFHNLSIVTHMEFSVKNIKSNPLTIKSLQFASQALSTTSANEIGTRFGNSIYPYKKSGSYYNYKSENPFSIYKGSSPYLYLTRYSGVQVRGNLSPNVNRGIAVPINQNLSSDYKVMAMQSAIRYDGDFFPYSPTPIFEIESARSLIKFFMVADSPTGKRAKIYAINAKTGQLENGITFYLNGNLVNDPVITIKEWSFLGISFANLLDFSGHIGSFRINGPLLMNLISDYKSTNLQEVQNVTKRPWFKVKKTGRDTIVWDFWKPSYKWEGVLVLGVTSYYGADPSDIYKTYVGTNKIIVDDYDTNESSPKILSFNDYSYTIYNNATWQSSITNAV